MKKKFVVSVNEIGVLVDFLKNQFKICRIFVFYGPLGAGKTTLVRELLKHCGVVGAVTSPTFTYLNLHKNEHGEKFCHFDLYRIEKLKDFLAAGFDEYLYDKELRCFIEWPETIEPLLKNGICRVKIDFHKDSNKRVVIVEIT